MEQFRSPPDMKTKQLLRKQADVSVRNTPTPRINIKTARSGCAARSSFPRGPTVGQPIWEASLLLLWSLLLKEGEKACRQEGRLLLTEFDLMCWHVIKDCCFTLLGFRLLFFFAVLMNKSADFIFITFTCLISFYFLNSLNVNDILILSLQKCYVGGFKKLFLENSLKQRLWYKPKPHVLHLQVAQVKSVICCVPIPY